MKRIRALLVLGGLGLLGMFLVSTWPRPGQTDAAGVMQLAAGGEHTCAITTSGSLKCWGSPAGDGTGELRPVPVDVIGLASGVSAVAGGEAHACAVVTAAVTCWGSNYFGQLGNSTLNDSLLPVNANGLSSGAVSVAAGYSHSCAVTATGRVKCWGFNDVGQVGNGEPCEASRCLAPLDVCATGATPPCSEGGGNNLTGVTKVVAGTSHTCALTAAGGVKCWGYLAVGDGSGMIQYTPVDVYGLTGGVADIASGYTHACALTTGGGVKCWGYNDYGEIGDGTTISPRGVPVDVSGLSAGVTDITAGVYDTCALVSSGEVKCWGYNDYGQLGNGTTSTGANPSPVDVCDAGATAPCSGGTGSTLTGITSIAAGSAHTCAIAEDSSIFCWGENVYGQLGNKTYDSSPVPVKVVGLKGAPTPTSTSTLGTPTPTPTSAATPVLAPTSTPTPGAPPVVSSITLFAADSSGGLGLVEIWNTQRSDGIWVLGVAESTDPSAPLLNALDPAASSFTAVAIPIDSPKELTLLGEPTVPFLTPGQFFGLNVFFDGSSTPGISARGQLGSSIFVPNGAANTVGASGFGTVQGANSLSFTASSGVTVTLASMNVPGVLAGLNRVGPGEQFGAIGSDDGAVTIELTTAGADGTPTPTSTPRRTPTRTPGPSATPTPNCEVFGDVNGDKQANAIDAQLILQFGVELVHSLRCQSWGDVNQDGRIDAIDAAIILQFAAGLVQSLPV